MLVLDSINFGSGWFPTLRKRPGMSGYFTVASALTDFWRASGGWSVDELRALKAVDVAEVLGQERGHELMTLYADALRSLGASSAAAGARPRRGGGAAPRAARGMLAAGMPFFDDAGFWKRAQIVPNDLALAGVAEFHDLDRLTIFADNLVPHVLRVDGVLVYDPAWRLASTRASCCRRARRQEIRACAVHACELLSRAARRAAAPARRGALDEGASTEVQERAAAPDADGLLLAASAVRSAAALRGAPRPRACGRSAPRRAPRAR